MHFFTGAGKKFQRGGLLIMTLVFVIMFGVIFMALSSMVNRGYRESVHQAGDELAFQVAEAGLNYARWRLAHDPDNLATETKPVEDQFAGVLGEYEVTFEHPIIGSTIVLIKSTGVISAKPAREVTLQARYGRPSLARYASITNGDVWYGGLIKGSVHSNGGIRMDGVGNSLMTSAKSEYPCMPHHGCSSPYETKPGIWGSGGTEELWEFPAPPVDYAAMTLDLLAMKDQAEITDTAYGVSGGKGYWIRFDADNTYSIYKVRKMGSKILSYGLDGKWEYVSLDPKNIQYIETKPVPSGGVIYVADDVWVKGSIRDRVTLAAGKFPDTPASNVDIIINGNISYGGVFDGSRAFAAVAQRHIMIPYSRAGDTLNIFGAYVAQKGSFHRRHYPSGEHRFKNYLFRYGMVASNGVPATTWVYGDGSVASGYLDGKSSYDANFLYGPPPFFPTSDQYDFLSWEEEQ